MCSTKLQALNELGLFESTLRNSIISFITSFPTQVHPQQELVSFTKKNQKLAQEKNCNPSLG